MTELKIQNENHFRALPLLSIYSVAFLVAPWFFGFDLVSMVIFGSALMIIAIPVLFIHIEYYRNDKNKTIQFTANEIRLLEEKTGAMIIIAVTEIRKIIIYQSANMNYTPKLPMEFYFYARIFTQTESDSFVITSLMLSNHAEEFNELRNISREFKRTLLTSPSLTQSFRL